MAIMENQLRNNSLKPNKMESPSKTKKTRTNLLGRKVTVTRENSNSPTESVKNKTREVYNPRTGSTKTTERVNTKSTTSRGEVVLDKKRNKKMTNAEGGSTSNSKWVQKRASAPGSVKSKPSKVVTKQKETISKPDAEFMSMSNRSVKVRGKVKGQKVIKDKGNYSKKIFNSGAAFNSMYGS